MTKPGLIINISLILLIHLICQGEPKSKTIREIIREPLPPEELSYSETDSYIHLCAPTFKYTVDKKSGAVSKIEVIREGNIVIHQISPLEIVIDKERQSVDMVGKTCIETSTSNQIIITTEGKWKSGTSCKIKTTFYNDGVVVFQYHLTPEYDVILSEGIRQDITVGGKFTHYLHKRRDTHGFDCYQGRIPDVGKSSRLYTPTSCLEVYSDKCAFALFTDKGDYYRSPSELDSASIAVKSQAEDENSEIYLHQHIIHIGETGKRYLLPKGETFSFRTGIAVAPNRLPHPRRHDLRMFIWVGDEKHPYPTDDEIGAVAQMGYTLFQMHRLGPPGLPREPVGELDRVIKTVHNNGMLFIWTENADLLYAHDPEVVRKMKEDKWIEWEGFNYNGRYKAPMDSFCDLVATCLASPNSLADYRIDSIKRMLDRYPVDGMYIDDNLAYANCKHWKEHNHPQEVYDCLIELHEVNWRRRETLKERIPHLVLIDHCSKAFVLPVITPFDVHLYGEGYNLPSVEEFRATFGSFSNMYAQGCLYAGDDEDERCPIESAYALDLLTGGGKYCSIDWRIWYEKFPYAKGVNPLEGSIIRKINLAQYYFGMYEAGTYLPLKTVVPNIYSVLYHNKTWDDYLIVVNNRSFSRQSAGLEPLENTINLNSEYYFVHSLLEHKPMLISNSEMRDVLRELPVEPNELKILYLRGITKNKPLHVWGGKRISEKWNENTKTLTVELDGPLNLQEELFFTTHYYKPEKIIVNGKTVETLFEISGEILSFKSLFESVPTKIEITFPDNER
ncbi:MAG: hypothetical protein N3G21_03375 [Candidatus Hydrogenedentes bacterium]|nr:hypothetical protein [Candidatus Hydrogenedentota bacterium]